MGQTFEIRIPFAGFYYSIHDDEIGREVEQLPEDWSEYFDCDMPQKLWDMFFDAADYGSARLEYAREYVESFCDEYLDGEGKFSGMESPREYNFETDRVFAKVTRSALARIAIGTDRDTLTRIAEKRHTSRSGFVSFYSPDWRTWGRLSQWDHNQLATLLLAYLATARGEEWDQWAEFELMDSYLCNGGTHSALWSDSSSSRPWAIWNHLTYDRPRRAIRTMSQWRRANQKPWETTPLGGAA